MKRIGIAVILLCAGFAAAQTTTTPPAAPAPTSITFAASTEAVAVNYKGAWGLGTHETESFDLVDFGAAKANHIALIGHEVTATSAGFASYLGGVRYMPNIGPLLAKTNIPPNAIAFYVDGAAGTSTYSSQPGNSFTALAGAGIQISVSQNISATAFNVGWLRVGSTNVAVISTGLKYFFN